MSSFLASPSTRLLLREKTGVQCFQGPPSISPSDGSSIPTAPAVVPALTFPEVKLRLPPAFAPDGSKVLFIPKEGEPMSVLNTVTGAVLCTLPCTDAEDAYFSPLGTFVVVFSAPKRGTATAEPPANLCIFRVCDNGASASLEAAFHLKRLTHGTLAVQWTADERLCARMNTNEIHLLAGDSPGSGIVAKVHHPKVANFQLTPKWVAHTGAGAPETQAAYVAVFTPEDKGKPARVAAYCVTLPAAGADAGAGAGSAAEMAALSVDTKPCATRTVFAASEARLLFSPSCRTLLVYTQSDVDTTGASYFGATGLFVMAMDGSLAEQVTQSKAGPVYDVQWSPIDDVFVVAAGTMPAHCTLYNNKAERQHEFGAAHRNTISWSPHGRFLALAGFGNLAGDIDFYDMHRRKPFGSANSHCAVQFGWSPDSRYFMTATLAPRMNVDNGLHIFKYNGAGPVCSYSCSDLAHSCTWIPAPAAGPGSFENRPPSPNSRRVKGASGEDTSKPAAVTQAYRPPGARGGVVSQMMARAEAPVGKVKQATHLGSGNGSGSSGVAAAFARNQRERVIPGLPTATPKASTSTLASTLVTAPSKSALKNAKRKEARKQTSASAAAAAAAAAAASADADNNDHDDRLRCATAVKVVVDVEWDEDPTPEEVEKRAKALRKKLKQIAELKGKRDKGVELNADQMDKLDSEAGLASELAQLELGA